MRSPLGKNLEKQSLSTLAKLFNPKSGFKRKMNKNAKSTPKATGKRGFLFEYNNMRNPNTKIEYVQK